MVSARVISVQLSGHKYDIVVQPGLYADAGAHLRKLTTAKKCVLMTEHNVPVQPALNNSLGNAGFTVAFMEIAAGEENKTIQTVAMCYELLLRGNIERSTPILAFGGGVIGDTVGFVAATVLRGVP